MDTTAKLAQLFSWESFGELLASFWENLRLPESDNSTIIFDIIVFHASVDPLIFAIRASLGVAFACWFQSMATGTHSWVLKMSKTCVYFVVRSSRHLCSFLVHKLTCEIFSVCTFA